MATKTLPPTPRAAAAGRSDPAPAPRRARIDSVDLLRGAVMVLMLLDHTRDFVHRDAPLFDAADLSRTTVALFLTRWVTHFCAPAFVFLAGAGAALQLVRGKPKRELSRFLLTRGAWLVVLEFTVVRLGVAFDLDYRAFPGMLQVIWAIGVSMMVLAALIHLRTRWVAAAGVAIVALHNLGDPLNVPRPDPGLGGSLWMVLHQPGLIHPLGLPLLVLYPLLPWLGVLLCGYCVGHVYGWEAGRRRRFLARLGAGLVTAFVVLRLANVYGDPRPWSVQKNAVFTALSFVNTNKYPPSLLFVLMTIGPALLVLAWSEGARRGPVGRALVTFGRVPLFFYLLQWFVSHGIALLLSLAAGKPTSHLFGIPAGTPPQPGAGFGLGVTYLCWAAGVALLYPLCRWFAGVRQRRDDWWLSYL
ncbi:MAG TPA: heparan-alpha-glucosaminide N-acetyltransferase domain-containing protein [Longimicrobium sp.]|nr:heparan-alpha-glucosaminide N-acetyltransferase domain-containing protein [Longimicrobium sp.]